KILSGDKGDLRILDGYNVHIHNQNKGSYSILSFNKNIATYFTNITVDGFINNEYDVPSLVCIDGLFYCIGDGKFTLLPSRILGKNTHIVIPKSLDAKSNVIEEYDLIFLNNE